MRLIQERPGWNWHSDDPAKLYIKDTGSSIEAPKMFKCHVMHDSVNCGESIDVEFEKLEFLASAIFGLGRPSSPGSNTKWTGDAPITASSRLRSSQTLKLLDGYIPATVTFNYTLLAKFDSRFLYARIGFSHFIFVYLPLRLLSFL